LRHRARFHPDLCRLQSGDGVACVIARAFAQTSAGCSRGMASRASSRALSPRPLHVAVEGWRRVRHRARFRPDLCRVQSGDGVACVIARVFAQTSAGLFGGRRRVRHHRARFRPSLCRVQTGDGVACVIARVFAPASAGCSRGMASLASSCAVSPRPLQVAVGGWRRVRHRARFRPDLCRLQSGDGVACVIARAFAQASAGLRQGMASRASSRAFSPRPLQGAVGGWRRVRHRAFAPRQRLSLPGAVGNVMIPCAGFARRRRAREALPPAVVPRHQASGAPMRTAGCFTILIPMRLSRVGMNHGCTCSGKKHVLTESEKLKREKVA
jgi:hypothetical protein